MNNNGKVILEAIRIVQQLGKESTALIKMIQGALVDYSPKATVRFEKSKEYSDVDNSGYVYDHVWITSQAKRNTKRGVKPVAGELTILFDFGKIGGISALFDFPCVVVAWSPTTGGWGFEEDFWTNFWPPRSEQITLRERCLFWWTESTKEKNYYLKESSLNSEWFYILPLTVITDEKIARDLLLAPVQALLEGINIADALKETEKFCRFDWNDDKLIISPNIG